jgi:hypothetical protein
LPPLDPQGIADLKKDEDAEYAVYWKERGGTPAGIPAAYAPIAVTPAMRLWIRIDEELLGGVGEDGCFYRPEALRIVLEWWEESILTWLQEVAGIGDETSLGERMSIARELLRQISIGRSQARAEEIDARSSSD